MSGPERDLTSVALTGDRGSRILGAPGSTGRGATAIGLVSTVVVFALLALAVVNTPGWSLIQQSFFDAAVFERSLPLIARSFLLNVAIFLVAEVFILVFALVLALLRSLSAPVFLPLRLLSVAYTDLFRGVPGVLVIYMLAFGVPSLGVPGVPIDPLFWGIVALVLIYSAYVAEVYRAGIDSVHPSQAAAARSLGLSHAKALRFVVLPQAVRRVIPPLLNDFIGLQKDTALVALAGPLEAFRRSQILSASTFNLTPYVVTALLFIAVTIPLARLTDRLIARDRRRQLASAR